jgi:eukaryotic-like serine/threonine-protein kinase
MQGTILAGRYRLLHQLGKGGMGSVWAAEHLALHSTVAVKLLDTEIAKNPEAVERFQREAQAAATLRSAHVVQVLDYGLEGSTPYLVMELLSGEDLAARLGRAGRLTPQQLVAVMQQVARAVGRAHDAGIVHRDLKPENIFLVNEGDHELVKVLDFGIAKVAPGFAPSATRTGVTMGTPYYMSPEQAEGKREVDHRTDLWALGVIASECLTGVRPFDGETFGELLLNICARPAPIPSSLAPVPRHFDAWFAKATHRDPAARFQSIHELVTTLSEVAAGRAPAGIEAIPMTTARTGARPAGPAHTNANAAVTVDPEDEPSIPVTGRWLLPAIVVLGLALLGIGGVWFYSQSSASAEVSTPSSPAAPGASVGVTSTAPSNVSARGAPEVELATSSAPTTPPHQQGPSQRQRAKASSPKPVAKTKPTDDDSMSLPAKVSASPTTEKTDIPAKVEPQVKPGVLRCVTDPFTGALRPAAADSAKTVACQRNSFTGHYQRL